MPVPVDRPAPRADERSLPLLRLDMLLAVVVLSEELHFGRAAERLCLSASGLSRRIQQLERTLEAELFVRNSRAVVVTAHGAALLPRARAMLAVAEQLHADLAAVRPGSAAEPG
ncbi:MAG: LysR family transcriptional regulator [Frankiales bacterium]|nr:LysR family transcriptional regulator [Frankiales bacterium]